VYTSIIKNKNNTRLTKKIHYYAQLLASRHGDATATLNLFPVFNNIKINSPQNMHLILKSFGWEKDSSAYKFKHVVNSLEFDIEYLKNTLTKAWTPSSGNTTFVKDIKIPVNSQGTDTTDTSYLVLLEKD
jgi:hypothetical protein